MLKQKKTLFFLVSLSLTSCQLTTPKKNSLILKDVKDCHTEESKFKKKCNLCFENKGQWNKEKKNCYIYKDIDRINIKP